MPLTEQDLELLDAQEQSMYAALPRYSNELVNPAGGVTYEYVQIERKPLVFHESNPDSMGDHQLIAIYENALSGLTHYQERYERALAEILHRARLREVDHLDDPDFICDIVSSESVHVEWKPTKHPFCRTRES